MACLAQVLGEVAARMRPTADIVHAYTNKITYARIYPWSGSLLVRQVVLRFDLDTVGQSKPASLSLISFFSRCLSYTFSLSSWLCLPPSSRLDGWPDGLGVFRFWRYPNFLF